MLAKCKGGEIIGRTPMVFFEHVMVGGEQKIIPFTKTVTWVAESETKLSMFHGGVLIKDYSSFTDFYGYLTSTDYNDYHISTAKELSVNLDSTLDLQLISALKAIPCFESDECIQWNATAKENNKKYKFCDASNKIWFRKQSFVDGELKTEVHRLQEIKIVESLIWSTKNTEDVNEQLKADFIASWQDVNAIKGHFLLSGIFNEQ